MATHQYQKSSEGKTIGSGSDYTFTVDAFSVPSGEKFVRYKVVKAVAVSDMDLRPISGQTSKPVWDVWNTNKALIGWSDGSTSKVKVHNSRSSGQSFRVYIVFETEDLPYTAVVKGNKVKASDLNQISGKSVKAGDIIKASDIDGKISAGTIITASAFNSKVLGL